MLERRVYQVVRRDDESWQVVRSGFGRPYFAHGSKAEAVLVAKRLAKAEPGARVVIYDRDNSIEREFSFSSEWRYG